MSMSRNGAYRVRKNEKESRTSRKGKELSQERSTELRLKRPGISRLSKFSLSKKHEHARGEQTSILQKRVERKKRENYLRERRKGSGVFKLID